MGKLNNLKNLAQVAGEFEDKDLIEPFDPAYLSDKGYEIPELSSREKKFLHKVSIIEKKLRRAKVSYEWLENWECFRVHKYVADSEYPTYRYVRVNMEENDYSFGTEKEDLVYDGHASVVVEAVVKWVNGKMTKKKVKYWVQPTSPRKGFCPTVCDTYEDAVEQHRFWASKTNFKWEIIEK